MKVSDEKRQLYIDEIYKEMRRRGYTNSEIPIVIGKTGFMQAVQEYPEEQMHYDVEDAVDEIIFVAAKN